MRYSLRQQHCLKAMGLVAWTCGKRNKESLTGSTLAQSQSHNVVPGNTAPENDSVTLDSKQTAHGFAEVAAAPDAQGDDGVSCASLAAWVEKQPLLPFSYRGSQVSFVGAEQARLVVVCMHSEANEKMPDASLPLSSQCASLLDLMIRAIELPGAAIRQCVVSRSSNVGDVSETTEYSGFDAVISPYVRAVLVLELHDIWQTTTVESDVASLPGSSLPIWRIPHPQILLDNSSLKRRAWENLKCVKKLLAQ